MNQLKTYKTNCKICKKKIEHVIYHISRLHGVKLVCLICNTNNPKFYNLKKLEVKNERR